MTKVAYNFTKQDIKKLADFFEILIKVDRKEKNTSKNEN